MPSMHIRLAGLVALVSMACAPDPAPTPPGDIGARTDVAAEAMVVVDGARDIGADLPLDTGLDADATEPPDGPLDAASELAVLDAQEDAAPMDATDAGADVAADAAVDVAADARTDASDATAAPDVVIEIPCRSDRDCSAMGQVCDPLRAVCVECVSALDCTGGRVCQRNRCTAVVRCTTSRLCPGQVCDLTLGYCVDCVTDVDCPTTGMLCRASACVPAPRACRSSRECSDLAQVCDTAAGHCVDCLSLADCPSGQYCRTDSTCALQVCVPGATRCVDSAHASVCNTVGSASAVTACGAGQSCRGDRCAPWTCTPGAASCADLSTRSVCNPDGGGSTASACAAGESCVAGSCQRRTCTPGTASCAGLAARSVCNPDGLSSTTTPCASAQSCFGGSCLPWTCTPGAASCADLNTRSVCNPDGLGVATVPCASSERCVAGACRALVCTPGSSRCLDARTASVCSTDGTSTATITCPPASTCVGTLCSSWTCTPGATSCASATDLRTCNPDGLTSSVSACAVPANASAASCAAGACTFTCRAGYADCDTTAANGCEVDTTTSTLHCGGCGRACAARPNATTSCAAGACGYVCATGFADCDHAAANGCEATLATDASNCGACGRACPTGQVCVSGGCLDVSAERGFQITSLGTTGCNAVEHVSVTGDDRGGIAASTSAVFYTGDTATGRFSLDGLGGTSVGAQLDALTGNLRTGEVFSLGNGTAPIAYGGGTVTTLLHVDGVTGAVTGTALTLSTPVVVTTDTGIFAGWDRVVLYAGFNVYDIDLRTGAVANVGTIPSLGHQPCESWAFWGTAEAYGGDLYLDYVFDSHTINRTRVRGNVTTTLATFSSLSDMCSFTVLPSRNRWYWHHEGTSQFHTGDESIGYCDASFATPAGCGSTTADPLNCGACGNACPTPPHTTATCAASACGIACIAGFGDCDHASPNGCETSFSTDGANCGACGNVCPTGQVCFRGTCSACPAPATTPQVLFYGPGRTLEQPLLPASVSTVATEAMWRAMSTADFARYDLIILGDNGAAITASQLQALYDTRFTWGPVISGRVVVMGLDAALHASAANLPATVLTRATLAWLSAGAGTNLYVSSDLGSRHLDYLEGVGTFLSVNNNDDNVFVTMPSHPILAGSSSSSLSNWRVSGHSVITAYPSTFQRLANLVTAGGDPVIVARPSTICER